MSIPHIQVMARGRVHDDVEVTIGPHDELVLAEVTLLRGESTGWHHHDGPLLVTVTGGRLTVRGADGCERHHEAGSSFVEAPGSDHVHVGENLGDDPVQLIVTYVLPRNAPLSTADAEPAAR